MKKIFWLFFWLTAPYALEAKILHLSFHRGCIQNFQTVAKLLNVEVEALFIPDLPPQQFDGISSGNNLYNISKERAHRIWKRHKQYFEQFDAIVVSDTAPLARIFLQNNYSKPLIIWICNRFDYCDSRSKVFPDAEYYQLMNDAKNRANVRIVAYTQFELSYAKSKGIDFGTTTITPIPYFEPNPAYRSIIPPSIHKESSFFIPPYSNETTCNLAAQCQRLGIAVYHGKYNGPDDLQEFKGIIHLPYAWSNLALFENLAAGLIYFVPSLSFIRQLAQEKKYYMQNENFFWDQRYQQENEWYNEAHKNLLIYFDSWQDLAAKVNAIDTAPIKRDIRAYCQQQTDRICQQWRTIFRSLLLLP